MLDKTGDVISSVEAVSPVLDIAVTSDGATDDVGAVGVLDGMIFSVGGIPNVTGVLDTVVTSDGTTDGVGIKVPEMKY